LKRDTEENKWKIKIKTNEMGGDEEGRIPFPMPVQK
jgi:hypothetical protein